VTKLCKVCNQAKSTSEFNKARTRKGGLCYRCKSCGKKYRESRKEEQKAYHKRYHKENRERICEQQKAYREANKERLKAKNKEWVASNKDRVKMCQRAYKVSHVRKSKEYLQLWLKNNVSKPAEYRRKRKALKLGTRHVPYRSIDIFERDGWICGICGRKINKQLKHPHKYSPSVDHIIPLSKGGIDTPINLQASHLECNLRKHTSSGGQLRLIS